MREGVGIGPHRSVWMSWMGFVAYWVEREYGLKVNFPKRQPSQKDSWVKRPIIPSARLCVQIF